MRSSCFIVRQLKLALFLCSSAVVCGQTTAITYQGRLTDSTIPANGNYNMQFALFAAQTGGSAIAAQSIPNVAVANGIFTVQIDFGACPACFDGSARYLEITVGTTILSTRQKLNSAPYAARSSVAGNALNLGGIAAGQFVQTTDPRLNNATISFDVVNFSSISWNVGNSSDYQSGNNQNPTLILLRGVTYKFNITAFGHPFRIASSQKGPAYTTGVTNNDIDNGTITFKVPMDAPDMLYYYCLFHPFSMFGTIQILSSTAIRATGSTGRSELDALKQQLTDQQVLIDKLRRFVCEQNPKAEPCVSETPKPAHMH